MKHTPVLMLALATALALTACAATTPVTKTDATDPWAALPKILARIVPPKFPARDFDVMLTAARLPSAWAVAAAGAERFAGRLPPRDAQPLYVDPPEAKLPTGGLRPHRR